MALKLLPCTGHGYGTDPRRGMSYAMRHAPDARRKALGRPARPEQQLDTRYIHYIAGCLSLVPRPHRHPAFRCFTRKAATLPSNKYKGYRVRPHLIPINFWKFEVYSVIAVLLSGELQSTFYYSLWSETVHAKLNKAIVQNDNQTYQVSSFNFTCSL